MLTKAFIPYRGYYSTPFCKWQGSLAGESAIELGAETSKRWFAAKNFDPKELDYLYLGLTVGQGCFRCDLGCIPMGAAIFPV